MAKIPPLVEGPRKGGRNPVRENFIRPDPPPAFRAKQMTTPTQAQIENELFRVQYRILFRVQCRILDLGTDKSLSAKELRKRLMALRAEIIEARGQMREHA